MQIRLDRYERCYPKRLKRWFQADVNYSSYNTVIPNMERAVIGNIPVELIKLFPKESRGEKIKLIQQILARTSVFLRDVYHQTRCAGSFSYYDKNYRYSNEIKSVAAEGERYLNQELQNFFGENFLQAKIGFAGFGDFANVFRLSLRRADGKKIMHDKALKVYHNLAEGDPRYAKSHNSYAEANFWTFLKRIAGHDLAATQFTKHYISDLHSGYCMTEFIDEYIPRTKSKLPVFDLFRFRVPKDKEYNIPIGGKECDGGGYEKGTGFLSDKISLRCIKMLYYAKGKMFDDIVSNLTNQANNPHNPNRDKIRHVLERFNQN
ncbi:MAG: hypothetical protein NC191_03275 [Muribaculaceae bacterium]|nr:hypothetical protein [Muribaculaceae bacterium]